jgi:F-type H+-transporting ATPase subunit alpha
MPIEEQVIAIYAGVRGYLDDVDISDINRCEVQLLDHIRSNHSDITAAIRDTGDLNEDTDAKLSNIVPAFIKTFV